MADSPAYYRFIIVYVFKYRQIQGLIYVLHPWASLQLLQLESETEHIYTDCESRDDNGPFLMH